ncbi:hypothetical protein TNCT_374961 [Trichonephila clavata]|uniref:Uncharacterized protein n=1 Tax=Trichonephila clavata TaxID=2740835 RepID=A0A8X6LZ64_TRICU|nr:hypothetical protein TNCT_374961 [Trichonephila clavata]
MRFKQHLDPKSLSLLLTSLHHGQFTSENDPAYGRSSPISSTNHGASALQTMQLMGMFFKQTVTCNESYVGSLYFSSKTDSDYMF